MGRGCGCEPVTISSKWNQSRWLSATWTALVTHRRGPHPHDKIIPSYTTKAHMLYISYHNTQIIIYFLYIIATIGWCHKTYKETASMGKQFCVIANAKINMKYSLSTYEVDSRSLLQAAESIAKAPFPDKHTSTLRPTHYSFLLPLFFILSFHHPWFCIVLSLPHLSPSWISNAPCICCPLCSTALPITWS